MKRISSQSAYVMKRVFPLLWFGVLALALVTAFTDGGRKPPLPFLIVPMALAVFGYVLLRKILGDLADEVFDCGDHLLVKFRGEEISVPLTNIMNVSASMLVNPPRITLRLVHPGPLGDEISFSPVKSFSLNPFARNPIADDLIVRVDRARSKRAF